MRKPTTKKQSEKTRLHRHEGRRDRRKVRQNKLTPEQKDHKEWGYAARMVFGEFQLLRLAEPLIEESRQREIARNIEDE
jgi:hypothetical protein